MASLAPKAVDQRNFVDRPEERLCEVSYLGETVPAGDHHTERDLSRSPPALLIERQAARGSAAISSRSWLAFPFAMTSGTLSA